MVRVSKRRREVMSLVDRSRRYSVAEAVRLLKGLPHARFDETVEVSVKLGIDPKDTSQSVRGAFSLPHGLGKAVRVIVFCSGEEATRAKEAGAIEAGSDELIQKVSGGWLDFDVAIASPDQMAKVGKLGRLLGPRGLMPSPKSGTVTPKVLEAVRESVAGRAEFRADAGGNVHAPVGKLSFDEKALGENVQAFLDYIRANRPASAKGVYFQKAVISSTMGPGIPLALA